MSCACNNKRLAQEYDRIWRLAKGWAKMEEATAVIYKCEDGTYGFASEIDEIDKQIVEYVTPY